MTTLSRPNVSANHDSERVAIQAATIERQRGEIASLTAKLRQALAGAGRLPGDIVSHANAALAAVPVEGDGDALVLRQASAITRLWVSLNEVNAQTK